MRTLRWLGASAWGAFVGALFASSLAMVSVALPGVLAGEWFEGLAGGWLVGAVFWPVGAVPGLILGPLFFLEENPRGTP